MMILACLSVSLDIISAHWVVCIKTEYSMAISNNYKITHHNKIVTGHVQRNISSKHDCFSSPKDIGEKQNLKQKF